MSDYRIELGIGLNTNDLADIKKKINSLEDNPIKLKIDTETKELTKSIQDALKSLSNGTKNALTLDTSKLEASFSDVKSDITEIRSLLSSLGNGNGIKGLVGSINQISTALDKASGKFDELAADLKTLSSKDFSVNIGLNMTGGSNPIARQTAYGNKARSETLPQLKQQISAFVKYYNDTYKQSADEVIALQKMVSGTKLGNGDFFQHFLFGKDSVISRMGSGSLSSQMQAYKEYIDMFKQAASLKGLDLSSVTSGFSKSADQLIQDAQDVQTGAKEMEDGFEKLKQVFGGNNNFNVEGISKQLDSIVVDLGEIKTALQGLSSGISVDGLTQSFDKLYASIEKLVKSATNVRTALNDSVGGLGSSVGKTDGAFTSVEGDMSKVVTTANDTSNALKNIATTLASMNFDNSSIDVVTKDLEEMGFAIKKASATLKDTNLNVTVEGIDRSGNILTVVRQFETAAGSISDVGKTISQTMSHSFDAGEGAVRELNKEMAAFVKLQTQISNIDFKIRSLEGVDDKTNQVAELKRQLEELQTTYARLMGTFMEKLTDNGDLVSMSDIARFGDEIAAVTERFEAKLREFKAKAADITAKNAEKIRLDFSTFDKQVTSVESDFGKLSNQTKELHSAIELVKQELRSMKSASTDDELIEASKRYKQALKEVENQLKQNKIIEQDSIDASALEQARSKLSLDMDNWLKKNSAAAKDFGGRIKELQAQLQNCDKATLNHLKAEFANIQREAQKAGKTTQTLGDRIKSQFEKYSQYLSIASMFMYIEQGLRDMFEQVKLIDSAMTELKKVTNETDESYNKFLTNAASRAKEIGTTIDGLVSSTADFARLGYGFGDAQGLAEVANIYAVVGDEVEGVEGATESLISTMAAFKDEMNGMSNADFAMSIIDSFNELGNNFAISSGGLGEALKRSASSLAAANNTIHESAALITAA